MMEAEGALARVERTLWTVWAFISASANRLLRPQPAPGVDSEHNSTQESGEVEPLDSGEGDTHTGDGPLVKASPLNSPRTVDIEQVLTEDNLQLEAAEKYLDQTRRDDSELLVTEDTKENEKEETQTSEDDKHEEHVGLKTLAGDVISEKIQTNEEDAVTTVCDVTTEDLQETSAVVQLEREDDDETPPEHEQKCETSDSEGDQCTVTSLRPKDRSIILKEDRKQHSGDGVLTQEEEGNRIVEPKVDQKMETDEEMARGNNQVVSHGDLTDVVDGEKPELVMSARSDNDGAAWSFDHREERAISEEENEETNNWTTHENSEENFQMLGEDSQKERVSFERLVGSDSTEKSPHEAEFTDQEPDAVDSRCIPENQALIKMVQTITAATVELEGETRWEMSRELESIPLGTSEGRVVMFEELNTPACEETQDGLPESNNELGKDENTTQRFLEVGDYKESQSAQLPEEVESSDQESLQNTEAVCLQMSESLEENRGDPKTTDLAEVEPGRIVPHSDTELLQETEGKLSEEASQDFDHPFKTELSEGPMKKEIRDLRTLDGTEVHLFGFGMDEAPSSSEDAVGNGQEAEGVPVEEGTNFTDKTLRAEAPEMTQEFLHTTEYSNKSLENDPTLGCWTHSTESGAEAQRDGTVDIKSNTEGECKGEPLGAEYDMTETESLAPMESDLITRGEEEENVKQHVLSTQVETGELNNQFPQRTFEIEMDKVISSIEEADDVTIRVSEAEDLSDMSTGESTKHENESLTCHTEGLSSSIGSHQDLTDEEVLDLWMETAMSSPSQQNSQDDLVEEIEAPNLLNQASVAEAGSCHGSEIKPMYQNSITTQGEEETTTFVKMETGLRKDLGEEANHKMGTQTEGSDFTMTFSSPDVLMESTTPESSDEVAQSMLGQSESGSWSSSEETHVLTKHSSESEKKEFEILPTEEQKLGDTAENSPNTSDAAFDLDDHTEMLLSIQVHAPALDFTPQRSRISLKNPRVRPPKDPRYLLNMPSLEPTVSSPPKTRAGLPLGGLGIGIKLPGLPAGFPLLKKTHQVVKDDSEQETLSQDAEKKPEEKGDQPVKEETPHKPKWMPPKHPGFGNPLMSELKTKLKKTSNE